MCGFVYMHGVDVYVYGRVHVCRTGLCACVHVVWRWPCCGVYGRIGTWIWECMQGASQGPALVDVSMHTKGVLLICLLWVGQG